MSSEREIILPSLAARVQDALTSDPKVFYAGVVVGNVENLGFKQTKPAEIFIAPKEPEFNLRKLNGFLNGVSKNTDLDIQRRFLRQGRHLVRLGLLSGEENIGTRISHRISMVRTDMDLSDLKSWGFDTSITETITEKRPQRTSLVQSVAVFVYPDPELAASEAEYQLLYKADGKWDYKMEAGKEAYTLKEFNRYKKLSEENR